MVFAKRIFILSQMIAFVLGNKQQFSAATSQERCDW